MGVMRMDVSDLLDKVKIMEKDFGGRKRALSRSP